MAIREAIRTGLLAALAGLALAGASPTAAAPLLESIAGASSDYYNAQGDLADAQQESETSAVPGETASAHVFLCLPSGAVCDTPSPGSWNGGDTAAAEARTDYGANGVRSYAWRYREYPGGITEVAESGSASSVWADEWTFFSLNPNPLGSVTIDVQVDGSWNDWGVVAYQISVYDPVIDPTLGFAVARAAVTSCGGPCTLADIEPTISIPGEGTAGGQLDSSLQLVFQPIANRQYRVVAEMHAQSTPETTGVDGPEVDALSTGRVTRVLLAPGMTMTSSAQALGNYNVTTPESGTLVLFGSALAVLAWRRRRP